MKQADKKEDLRRRLVVAARDLIAERGLGNLKARDVAEQAGSALGSLYTVFADLDALVFAVNLESFQMLDETMRQAAQEGTQPGEKLSQLVWAYLTFARIQPNLWRAMFEHRLPDGRTFPPEHFEALTALMHHIAGPLAALMPEADEAARLTRARTLFSAFHGVIAMSLDHRFTGLSDDALEQELRALLALLFR